jgi:hypothetical protein
VASVWFRVNAGGWQSASTQNNWTNWTATAANLVAGTNLLQAYALDVSGYHSDIITVELNFVTPFTFSNGSGAITITGYTGPGGTVSIPDQIGGVPVHSIGDNAFNYCYELTNLVIPSCVTNIGSHAFADCSALTAVYFQGAAPAADATVFLGSPNVIVYYLPGSPNWGTTFAGLPARQWLPQLHASAENFGMSPDQFGFTVTWSSGQSVVVEACTNLFAPVWQPMQTNLLASGTAHFSDPQWTKYPARFYRVRSP